MSGKSVHGTVLHSMNGEYEEINIYNQEDVTCESLDVVNCCVICQDGVESVLYSPVSFVALTLIKNVISI